MPPKLLQNSTNASTEPSMPAVGTATTPDLSEMTPTVIVVSVTPRSVAPCAGWPDPHAAWSVPTLALVVAPVVDVTAPPPSAPEGGGPLSRVPQPATRHAT